MKHRTDLILGEAFCIFIFFYFPDSGLSVLNGLQFYSLIVTVKTVNKTKPLNHISWKEFPVFIVILIFLFFFYKNKQTKKKQNKTHKNENKINVIQSWSSFLITIIPFEHIVLFIAIIGRGSVYAMINYSVWGRCHPPKLDNTLRVYIVREQIIF